MNYYKSGVPIVICGDDPGAFGYNDLSVDYYLAYMAWGIDVHDLRVLANNSIKYSMASDEIKLEGLRKFENEWSMFVNRMSSEICESGKQRPFEIEITGVLPSYGPCNQSNRLAIFGRGFDSLLCKNIQCLFNKKFRTRAKLIKLNRIECRTPKNEFLPNQTANVWLQIDQNLFPTEFKFTFI